MRVVNVMQCTNLGGMERASLSVMKGLGARGHACRVLSLNPIGALGPLLAQEGIPAAGLPYLGVAGWRSHHLVRRALRECSADAVVMTGHHLLTISALRLVGARRRILAIHYHHEGVKPRWQWKLIYALAMQQFSAITFPSHYVRREAVAIHPAVEAVSEVVRNPIAFAEVPTEIDRWVARRSLELPPQAQVVGSAGWLTARKRVDVFLRVAARVAEERPRTIFVVAGDGPERARLVRLAKDLGIGERVRWLGWLSEMSSFYRSLDVLLFNSDWDAFPTTPLESMAHGVPLVASLAHGGLGEVVENGRSGILLNRHDIDTLCQAVLRSLEIDGPAIGLAGRRRIQELCNWDTTVGCIERLLRGS